VARDSTRAVHHHYATERPSRFVRVRGEAPLGWRVECPAGRQGSTRLVTQWSSPTQLVRGIGTPWPGCRFRRTAPSPSAWTGSWARRRSRSGVPSLALVGGRGAEERSRSSSPDHGTATRGGRRTGGVVRAGVGRLWLAGGSGPPARNFRQGHLRLGAGALCMAQHGRGAAGGRQRSSLMAQDAAADATERHGIGARVRLRWRRQGAHPRRRFGAGGARAGGWQLGPCSPAAGGDGRRRRGDGRLLGGRVRPAPRAIHPAAAHKGRLLASLASGRHLGGGS